MKKRLLSGKALFALGTTILIVLNLYTFVAAYPEMYALDSGINAKGQLLAKDFSAFYSGAWRLLHDPSQIYKGRTIVPGEPAINPQPEAYKYLPSFLLIVSPFIILNYQQALLAFDIVQFAFLPVMALLLYELLNKKGLALTFVVAVIALLLPLPMPNWGFSASYFWQWGEGQAKVLLTFLLLLAFYLGVSRRPVLSGIVFAFGFFDPRFGLLALPLFLAFNRKNLLISTGSMLATLAISNVLLLYPGTGSGFLNMILSDAVSTPLYYYSLIPLFTMGSLWIVNARELVETFSPSSSPLALKRK
jgi:hypothetical protein